MAKRLQERSGQLCAQRRSVPVRIDAYLPARYKAMPPCPPLLTQECLQQFCRAGAPVRRAQGNHHGTLMQAGAQDPAHALGSGQKVRNLRHRVGGLHLVQVTDDYILVNPGPRYGFGDNRKKKREETADDEAVPAGACRTAEKL